MRDTALDRLYRLLPGSIRARDAEEGRPLQALMQLLTRELEHFEGDTDALYDNLFIETCEDWVVPYIGDLVGARPLRPFGEGGGSLRAYVANTISYRRAKGTIAVIEQLGRDVSGWPCVAVEFFRRLIQTQHVNHVRPDNLGTADLSDTDAASLTGGPFEAASHLVDVRSITQGLGRYNIPNVGLFVWRLQSYLLPFVFDGPAGYLGGVVPVADALGPGFRHFDPIGRPLRLFNRPRTEASIAEAGSEPTMPGPLRRRPRARDLDDLRAERPAAGRYVLGRTLLAVRLDGANVPLARLRCCNLEDRPDGQGGTTWGRPANAGDVMFDPELGRLVLHADDEGKSLEVAYAYGAPHDIGGGPYDRRLSVQEWIAPYLDDSAGGALWRMGVTQRGEALNADPAQGPLVTDSIAKAIEAWNEQAVKGSRGIIAIMDNASYRESLATQPRVIKILAGARLAIVAAGLPDEANDDDGAFSLAPQDRRPHIASNLRARGSAKSDEAPGALVLDGLLIEGMVAVDAGDLGRLEVRHCTIGAGADALGPGLLVRSGQAGTNARLSILAAAAILGDIAAATAAGQIAIRDTVIGEDRSAQGDAAASAVLVDAPEADLVVQRATIFGKIVGRTLEADDSIFCGPLAIARRQQGCARFCYVPEGSRTPRRYRCTPDLQLAIAKEQAGGTLAPAQEQAIRERIRPLFTSTMFGHYAFAQLARRCPPEISAGADGGLEMGAMNRLGAPARLANMTDALEEYLPFGLAAGVVFVT